MADKESLTPERELLKLIEEPPQTAAGKVGRAKLTFDLFRLFSPAALKARFSFLRGKLKGGFKLQSLMHLEFAVVNRTLEACIFILIFYLISNLIFSLINLNRRSNLAFETKKIVASAALAEASLLKVSSYYLEKARARDIFKMGLSSVADTTQVSEVPISKIAEASKKLKLVGISWSKDPDVIIEDTDEKKAYFLKRGQLIRDFEVKAIFKEKVVLSYQGEEVELR